MMWKQASRQLAAVALMALLAISSAWAESPVIKRITKAGELRVGMTGDQVPFNFTNRDGEIVGMDVQLAGLLAKSMGVDLKIVTMEFSKLIPALEDGDVDLVMSGMTSTLQRNVQVPFVTPYYVSGMSMLTKSETLARIQAVEELDQEALKVAVLRGSTSELFAENMLDNAAVIAEKSHADAIKSLIDGKVDAFVADAPYCAIALLRYPNEGFITLKEPLSAEPIGIAVAPGDAHFLNLIENFVQALRITGALEYVQSQWFQNGTWLAQLP